jgi:hypothetical protein
MEWHMDAGIATRGSKDSRKPLGEFRKNSLTVNLFISNLSLEETA